MCRRSSYLRNGGESITLNCGYGHGYSVREVLRMVEYVAQRPLQIREEARRAGDPSMLIARADRVREVLGWTPRLDDLEIIVRTSLDWERRQLDRTVGLVTSALAVNRPAKQRLPTRSSLRPGC